MRVDLLVPSPSSRELFQRNRERFIPLGAGCYTLTTFSGSIIYIGLSESLRRRFGEHLDNPSKTAETRFGRAFFFYWIETPDTFKVERTWLNIHLVQEGLLPVLNSNYSPVST
ncbi:GIY-YIG nuclease family protein [Rhodopseudomonas sp.]|uniref:GIY-YIG nuclease family protein n=1 Tax=Rhodopseudomonas sp. TaxID=1078 RepID=UPI0039E57FCD